MGPGGGGVADLTLALEALVDATINHLHANPRLDGAPNAVDCNNWHGADARSCLERCAPCTSKIFLC
jgi:hypothetical protein